VKFEQDLGNDRVSVARLNKEKSILSVQSVKLSRLAHRDLVVE